MAEVEITDNSADFLRALEAASLRALEICGQKAESYAKGLAPPKWGSELRNSITHEIIEDVLHVGSNMEIAAYAELGTGKEYQPGPEWLENNVPKGTKVPAGIDHWIYFDALEGVFKIGAPQVASPYLRPAIENHLDEYQHVMENELKNAEG